jgi:peptide/nickel transport system permease protein
MKGRVWQRFRTHRLAVAGLVTVTALLLAAILAPILAPRDPTLIETQLRFLAPFANASLPLGSDELGRDTLSRLLHGGRVSLTVGLVAMITTVLTGALVGIAAGYLGGIVDTLLMRFVDTMLCFPQVFLLLVVAAFVPPTLLSISLVIGLTSWMEVSRIVRAEILQLKEQDFVAAARALGASRSRIMFRELLPNAAAPILVAATLKVASAVLMESYISYLGYGVQPPLASWGNMLTNAQGYLDTVPWLAILPGLMITLTVMGFNFLGDGLRDALDPRPESPNANHPSRRPRRWHGPAGRPHRASAEPEPRAHHPGHDAGAGAVQPAALRQCRHRERPRSLHVRRAVGCGCQRHLHPQPRGRGAQPRQWRHLGRWPDLESQSAPRCALDRRAALHRARTRPWRYVIAAAST